MNKNHFERFFGCMSAFSRSSMKNVHAFLPWNQSHTSRNEVPLRVQYIATFSYPCFSQQVPVKQYCCLEKKRKKSTVHRKACRCFPIVKMFNNLTDFNVSEGRDKIKALFHRSFHALQNVLIRKMSQISSSLYTHA